ncbi:hypothetical protein GIS00_02965 [Nakamurella sp. YIM 132087]|uniref:SnoaL-like domain-containing protein n=1 Tax=Nakamurella alba TaxID=2665158 RepID=A0A7K1FFQ8_9ACTN|nr:nuclear transport factor 2 family protein [Nakamurella alba]MTD12906.1 hypothetical protein [Nakamurella alba]
MTGQDAASIWLAYNVAENRADFATMSTLVAPDLVATVNGVPAVSSAEEDERAMRRLLEQYPDYRREVVEVIAAGERATARWRMRGTPADPAHPVLDVQGCSIVTAADGVMTGAALYYQGDALDASLSGNPG